tara:strand:- start:315 stop:725 length:411 start_codon:yes stop_codon:yes gene_type:complete
MLGKRAAISASDRIVNRQGKSMNDLEAVRQGVANFAKERDWEQFHSPKNLAMALSVEVAELMEHFQWLSEAQSSELDEITLAAVADEIADVQVYLVRIADTLGVDILAAVKTKMEKNAQKYPADKVRGSAKKYNAY